MADSARCGLGAWLRIRLRTHGPLGAFAVALVLAVGLLASAIAPAQAMPAGPHGSSAAAHVASSREERQVARERRAIEARERQAAKQRLREQHRAEALRHREQR
ncbi:MAG TPA: hypothetical protein VNZ05_02455, partial [Solirubrobacteraceae bacterium]|nr:hypothetical protein [Solirubrobacteraceae bacterium]